MLPAENKAQQEERRGACGVALMQQDGSWALKCIAENSRGCIDGTAYVLAAGGVAALLAGMQLHVRMTEV